jgi:hypothetical protein
LLKGLEDDDVVEYLFTVVRSDESPLVRRRLAKSIVDSNLAFATLEDLETDRNAAGLMEIDEGAPKPVETAVLKRMRVVHELKTRLGKRKAIREGILRILLCVQAAPASPRPQLKSLAAGLTPRSLSASRSSSFAMSFSRRKPSRFPSSSSRCRRRPCQRRGALDPPMRAKMATLSQEPVRSFRPYGASCFEMPRIGIGKPRAESPDIPLHQVSAAPRQKKVKPPKPPKVKTPKLPRRPKGPGGMEQLDHVTLETFLARVEKNPHAIFFRFPVDPVRDKAKKCVRPAPWCHP